jgi:choline kinase
MHGSIRGHTAPQTADRYRAGCRLTDLHVATGYREDAITYAGVTKHFNPEYATTNMVESLFCAEEIMDDDLIVAYGDIVYQPDVLQAIIDSPHPVSVVGSGKSVRCFPDILSG